MDSWYSDSNIYQAKEFPLDDYYSQVGSEARNLFQRKTSWIAHSRGVGFSNGPTKYVNPLKANSHLNPMEMKFTHIPLIKWNCPPKFSVDHKWQVASGEESEETVTQRHRETRVVEAVYPHLSAIPPSPSEPLDMERCRQDDDCTIPVIPIIAIEEAAEPSLNIVAAAPPNSSVHSQPPDLPQGSSTPGNINMPQIPALGLLAASGGDVAADAASVALTALIKSQEMGSLIDKELLIEILSNPQLIEKLTDKTGCDTLLVRKPVTESLPLVGPRPEMVKSISDHRAPGAPASTGTAPISGPEKTVTLPVNLPGSIPKVINNFLTNENGTPISWSSKNWINENCTVQTARSKPVTLSVPLPSTKPDLVTIKRMINEYGPPVNTGNKQLGPANMLDLGNNVRSPSPGNTYTPPIAPPFKDVNYFKGLIKEHGERRVFGKLSNDLPVFEPVKNLKSSESKSKYEKPCIYFNSSLGCRRGSSCLYKHIMSDRPARQTGWGSGATGAKRLRL